MSELDVLKERIAYLKVLPGRAAILAAMRVSSPHSSRRRETRYAEPSSDLSPRLSNHGITSVSLIEYG